MTFKIRLQKKDNEILADYEKQVDEIIQQLKTVDEKKYLLVLESLDKSSFQFLLNKVRKIYHKLPDRLPVIMEKFMKKHGISA